MSSEEKLRALLAEARERLAGESYLTRQRGFGDSAMLDRLTGRIDAALAEPVEDYEALYRTNLRCECSDYDACLLTRQRDEARAEVERLQAELVRVARAEFDRGAKQGVDQALWASRTAQETAYQRGAEAMREAAAKACEGVRSAAAIDNWIWVGCRGGCVDAIRALPLPEDKP